MEPIGAAGLEVSLNIILGGYIVIGSKPHPSGELTTLARNIMISGISPLANYVMGENKKYCTFSSLATSNDINDNSRSIRWISEVSSVQIDAIEIGWCPLHLFNGPVDISYQLGFKNIWGDFLILHHAQAFFPAGGENRVQQLLG